MECRQDLDCLESGITSDWGGLRTSDKFDKDNLGLLSNNIASFALSDANDISTGGIVHDEAARLRRLLDSRKLNSDFANSNNSKSLFPEVGGGFFSSELSDRFKLQDARVSFPSSSANIIGSKQIDFDSSRGVLSALGKPGPLAEGVVMSSTSKLASESVVSRTVDSRLIDAASLLSNSTAFAAGGTRAVNVSAKTHSQSTHVNSLVSSGLLTSNDRPASLTARVAASSGVTQRSTVVQSSARESRAHCTRIRSGVGPASVTDSEILPLSGPKPQTSALVGREGTNFLTQSTVKSSSSSAIASSSFNTLGDSSRELLKTGLADSSGGFESHAKFSRQHHETEARVTNGVTHVRRQHEQSEEQAQLQVGANGVGRVDAVRHKERRQAEAVRDNKGVTAVRQTGDSLHQQRQAELTAVPSETGGSLIVPMSVKGSDSHRQMAVQYVHKPEKDGVSQQVEIFNNPMDNGMGLPGFGLLIIPPAGGKLQFQFGAQGVESSFEVGPGVTDPRHESRHWAVSGSFMASESDDSDSETEGPSLRAPKSKARLSFARRKRLSWQHKPAIEYRSPKTSDLEAESVEDQITEAEAETVNAPSPGKEDDDRVAKRQKRLHCIAKELLSTEQVYVRRLHLIDQIFHRRVLEANKNERMFSGAVSGRMFSNSGEIYRLHKEKLLPRLEERLQQWQHNPRIGDIMREFAPSLKIYGNFASNFDNAMKLIQTFSIKCSRFAAIIAEIAEMEESVGLPLSHHMIVPIQRVPRYEMLLRDYCSRLPDDALDRHDSHEALKLVMAAASHSNEMIRGEEQLQTLLKLQRTVGGAGELATPGRKLVKQGAVTKISARGGTHQERHLFLFSDLLLLCSVPLIKSGPAYKVKTRFNLRELYVLEGDNLEIPNTFYIYGANRKVELYTDCAAEKCQWLECVCSCLSLLLSPSPSSGCDEQQQHHHHQQQHQHQQQQTEGCRLGQSPPAALRPDSVARCMVCDSQFGVVRRRHSCRACGLVVCAKCSCHRAELAYRNNRPMRVCGTCKQMLSSGVCPADQQAPAPVPAPVMSYSKGQSVLQVPADGDSLESGWLEVRVRRSWQRRWCCLRCSAVLFTYEGPACSVALTATLCAGLSCVWPTSITSTSSSSSSSTSASDKGRVFKLIRDSRCYQLRAECREDADRWLTAIQRVSRLGQGCSGEEAFARSEDSISDSVSTEV